MHFWDQRALPALLHPNILDDLMPEAMKSVNEFEDLGGLLGFDSRVLERVAHGGPIQEQPTGKSAPIEQRMWESNQAFADQGISSKWL